MTTENENTPNEAEVTAELAKPDDVTEYVAERHEQEDADRSPAEDEVDATVRELRDKYPELKEAKKAIALRAPETRSRPVQSRG